MMAAEAVPRLLLEAAGLASSSSAGETTATTTSSTLLSLATAPFRPLHGGGFLPAFTQAVAFYYLIAALLAWVVPRLLPVRGIQPAPPRPGDVWRDATGSIGPLAVKAAIWASVERLHAAGLAPLVYTGPALWPPPALEKAFGIKGAEAGAAAAPASLLASALYASFCVFLLDLSHDAWFYWTHRLLHTKLLYRKVHYEHHLSRAPTPFTGYSFHVLEAALVFANEILVCYCLPLHLSLHRVYHLLTGAVHQAGHAGYELAPFIPTVEGLAAYSAGCAVAGARAAGRAVVGAFSGGGGLSRAQSPPLTPAGSDDGLVAADKQGEKEGGSGKKGQAAAPAFFWGGGLWSPPASRAPSAGGGGGGNDSTAARSSFFSALLRRLLVPPSNPYLNTVQHHDLHHRHPRLHFSLYFTHWDRLMGTLHPSYDEGLFRYGAEEAGDRVEGEEVGEDREDSGSDLGEEEKVEGQRRVLRRRRAAAAGGGD
jgi:sterol desaturase/sphingolipid hydroxylase (fatty acid hydroxylase superfamily)